MLLTSFNFFKKFLLNLTITDIIVISNSTISKVFLRFKIKNNGLSIFCSVSCFPFDYNGLNKLNECTCVMAVYSRDTYWIIEGS